MSTHPRSSLGHGDDLVAAEGHRRRVGAVGRVRDDHLVADPALGRVPGPHQQQSGELAGRPGRRLQGGGGHAGDLAQRLLQLDQQRQPALGHRRRGGRMDAGEAGQPGHRVAHLGVVLHGARPERVRPEVDRELAVGQAGEVGHQVPLGHLGHRRRGLPAAVGLGHEFLDRHLGDPGRAEGPGPASRMGQLEQGRLGVAPRAAGRWPPCRRGHRSVVGVVARHHATALASAVA